jgi:hypothetical protein
MTNDEYSRQFKMSTMYIGNQHIVLFCQNQYEQKKMLCWSPRFSTFSTGRSVHKKLF